MKPNNLLKPILTIILVLILVGGFVFLVNSKSKQTEKIEVEKVVDLPNCITSEELSNCAYLVGLEKKSDGYWYLSFDNVWFNQDNTGPIDPINEYAGIKTFMVSQDLKVGYDFTNSVIGDKFYDFEIYRMLLKKKGNYYWNPEIQKNDSFQHNGLYEYIVEDGLVVKIYEGGDFTAPQGT